MGYLPKKTLEDLEFYRVTEQIADFAITPMGKASCVALVPMSEPDSLRKELLAVSEYLALLETASLIFEFDAFDVPFETIFD